MSNPNNLNLIPNVTEVYIASDGTVLEPIVGSSIFHAQSNYANLLSVYIEDGTASDTTTLINFTPTNSFTGKVPSYTSHWFFMSYEGIDQKTIDGVTRSFAHFYIKVPNIVLRYNSGSQQVQNIVTVIQRYGSNYIGDFEDVAELELEYPSAENENNLATAYVLEDNGFFQVSDGEWVEVQQINAALQTKQYNTFNINVQSGLSSTLDVTPIETLAAQMIMNAVSNVEVDYKNTNTALTGHIDDTANPHNTTIENLEDTTITSISNGNILRFDGTDWINTTDLDTAETDIVNLENRMDTAETDIVDLQDNLDNNKVEKNPATITTLTQQDKVYVNDGNEKLTTILDLKNFIVNDLVAFGFVDFFEKDENGQPVLPEGRTKETNKIYLFNPNNSDIPNDQFEEWIYRDDTDDFEKIGTTQIALDNYYSITQVNALLDQKGELDTIDNHIDDSTIHFTQANISITESQISDLGSYEPANSNIQTHIGTTTGNPHSVTKTDVGLGNVTNDSQIPLTQKGAADGVATLNSSGKLIATQIPDYLVGGLKLVGTFTRLGAATNPLGLADFITGSYATHDYTISTQLDTFTSLAYGNDDYDGIGQTYIGSYWIATENLTLQDAATLDEASWNTAVFDDGVIPNNQTLLQPLAIEAGDWLVITSWDNVNKVFKFSVINNTYSNATTENFGVSRLSDVTNTSSLSGNDVITEGVLNSLIGTTGTANKLASAAHTHVIADTTGLQNALDGKVSTTGDDITGILNFTGVDKVHLNQNGVPILSTFGTENTFVGRAGNTTTTGTGLNTAVGFNALVSNTTGAFNSALGRQALQNNTTGSFNNALGVSALLNNTTGDGNSAVGVNALLNNTTGSDNSALGLNALQFNTTGSDNSALGLNAGRFIANDSANQTGSNSVFIGNYTTALANGQVNQIVIGNNATGNGSNTVTLGHTDITQTHLRGNVNMASAEVSGELTVQSIVIGGFRIIADTSSATLNFETV